MDCDAISQELNEPLIQRASHHDEDSESLFQSQATTVASSSRVEPRDEADAAGGIDTLSSQPKAKMNGFVLAVMIFFNASGMPPRVISFLVPSIGKHLLSKLTVLFHSSIAAGGPFGVEPSLKAAGNLYAIIGFAAMPFLWSLPEAVMTYELSSLYPCASGGVRFVRSTSFIFDTHSLVITIIAHLCYDILICVIDGGSLWRDMGSPRGLSR